jgi:hypothetical protein
MSAKKPRKQDAQLPALSSERREDLVERSERLSADEQLELVGDLDRARRKQVDNLSGILEPGVANDELESLRRAATSAGGSVSVMEWPATKITRAAIVRSGVFDGRKRGSLARETIYLVRLRKKYHYESAEGVYKKLRDFATDPADPRNPTPGVCPFQARVGAESLVFKRGKPYGKRTLGNALSDIDKRLNAGEFDDI